ncbi:hypothetical protein FOPG_18740 [Fusarium oxysporum f. sp. conglutinans race 2 54008]|uniref:Uncharacterized protein n=1 Tax=Fusarium oxysporum f. sp. conglutinans race 2 54008 TaxID=1089457 RepID=X0GNY2_FUSOX|nr:hypothetical protein FOPG_18740 [Fusarium oxysporum f. sp. conglutinans race 2 54008]
MGSIPTSKISCRSRDIPGCGGFSKQPPYDRVSGVCGVEWQRAARPRLECRDRNVTKCSLKRRRVRVYH